MCPLQPEETLEQFLINRFGRELYLTFLKSYTEKVCREDEAVDARDVRTNLQALCMICRPAALRGKGGDISELVDEASPARRSAVDVTGFLDGKICPMNSLVQRAGRCARFESQHGLIHVYDVPNALPYAAEELDTTRRLLPAPTRAMDLVPEVPNPERSPNWKAARSDDEGRFSFTGVAPGDYRLYAWEDS